MSTLIAQAVGEDRIIIGERWQEKSSLGFGSACVCETGVVSVELLGGQNSGTDRLLFNFFIFNSQTTTKVIVIIFGLKRSALFSGQFLVALK